MDITNFITWFIAEVVKIFSKMFNILDSITFANTSLLRVIVTIIIISTLLPVIITIVNSPESVGQRSERVGRNSKKEKKETKE